MNALLEHIKFLTAHIILIECSITEYPSAFTLIIYNVLTNIHPPSLPLYC